MDAEYDDEVEDGEGEADRKPAQGRARAGRISCRVIGGERERGIRRGPQHHREDAGRGRHGEAGEEGTRAQKRGAIAPARRGGEDDGETRGRPGGPEDRQRPLGERGEEVWV